MADKTKDTPRGARRPPGAPDRRKLGGSRDSRKRSGFSLRNSEIEDALITGEHRDLLEAYFGEELYEELRGLATRARTARARGGPKVLVLPGIMGSKLGLEGFPFDDTIWVGPDDILLGHLTALSLAGGSAEISALGVMLLFYLKIKLRLNLAGFDARYHPFDWRCDIAELGRGLAERIQKEAGTKGRRLSLVAHSMGGLVARAAIKELDASGDAKKIQRLIMLGTPNYGSFCPVQALSGCHPLLKKIGALDLVHSAEELVNEVFNTFPGLYQMLPAERKYTGYDLYNPRNWPSGGARPRSGLLREAPNVYEHLVAGRPNFALIAGINQETTVGVRLDEDRFVFTESLEGDGTVPLALATLEGVTTYYVEESHGSLPNNRQVTRAVVDLLETGRTETLPTEWTPQRRGETWEVTADALAPEPFDGRGGDQVSARELRHLIEEFAAPSERVGEDVTPIGTGPPTATSDEPIVVGRRRQQRIDLCLAHGSITQVDARAVVLGLFRGVSPSGAARAIDVELDGVITEFTERRMLSANVGEVFIMPTNRYRMNADIVVFAGLGSYDDFDEEVLRLVAENVVRALVRTKVDSFATVLLSSGSGMPTADVLSNLVGGFLRGISEGDQQGHLYGITLCETSRQRFREMHRELIRLTTTSMFDNVEATISVRELPPLPLPRAVTGRVEIPEEDPVYLIVREVPRRIEEPTDLSVDVSFALRASVLTAGSKATVVTDTIDVDAGKLNRHLAAIEMRDLTFTGLDEFGADLGKLILPKLVHEALVGMRERRLIVIHDARSGRIPWETVRIGGWYPAAEAGLSRKYVAEDLTVAKWLEERRLASELSVLLIVDPTEDLPGAALEGTRIKTILNQDPLIHVEEMWKEAASYGAVRAAFRSGRYDVIHYAGHAFFDPNNRARSGILCHGREVLSGGDLANLEKLPAVVFFNACESGRVRSPAARENGKATAARLEVNAGLAEAFLRAGVGNFIGTYWPVGDAPAKVFGETFYGALVRGEAIGVALNAGRAKVRKLKSVDWADYIHYGSPSFLTKRRQA